MKDNLNIKEFTPTLVWEDNNLILKANNLLKDISLLTVGRIVYDSDISEDMVYELSIQTLKKYISERMHHYWRYLNNSQNNANLTAVNISSKIYQKFIEVPSFDNYVNCFTKNGISFSCKYQSESIFERIIEELISIEDDIKVSSNRIIFTSEIPGILQYDVKSLRFEGQVKVLYGKDYYDLLIEKLSSCKKSVFIVAFIMSSGKSKSHPVNMIVDRLIDLKNSGVSINVIIDKDKEEDIYLTRKINLSAFNKLKKNGIAVYWNSDEYVTHTKLIIIDEIYTFIGSHNLSESSLIEYDETSVLVKDQDLSKFYINEFYKRIN